MKGNFTEYVGNGIEECEDGICHMSQLITKIIKTIKMSNCKPNWTPITQVALGSDPKGEPYNQKDQKYAHVVGM